MHKLIAELQRLYFLPGQPWPDGAAPDIAARTLAGEAEAELDLADAAGRVRTLAVGFRRASDWERAAECYRRVQADLDLPAPAVSVSPGTGFVLWFSLAEPVPIGLARDFLAALRHAWLADLPPDGIVLYPGESEAPSLPLVPACQLASGRWSAFVDPALGGMFADGTWLEMAPNLDKQADLLAGLASIGDEDFLQAFDLLPAAAGDIGEAPREEPRPRLGVSGRFDHPVNFLLAVMNDPAADPGHRIEAAKALLPYFPKPVM